MEIIAHGLWAAAAAITAKNKIGIKVHTGWTAWWAVFPDVLAFGPGVAAGVWLWAEGGSPGVGDHLVPRVHIGLPLYPMGHSLPVFLLVFAIVALAARRIVWELLGWMSHILIDIPTHSFSYYATRFLWPVSDLRIDGIPWWTPWFWVATYVVLALVYFRFWQMGWIGARPEERAGAKDVAIPPPSGPVSES